MQQSYAHGTSHGHHISGSPAGDGHIPSISNGSSSVQDMYIPQYQHAQATQPQQTQRPNPLEPIQGKKKDWIYSLSVEQQPVRARMCGFGDKDRRPITPPPCIRLVLRDAKTHQELDYNDIDSSFYILTVDLYDSDGTREVNLVRHTTTTGDRPTQISSTSTTHWPPPINQCQDRQQMYQQPPYDPYNRGPPLLANPPQAYGQAPQQQMAQGYYSNAPAPPQPYQSNIPSAPYGAPSYPQSYGVQSQYPPNAMPPARPADIQPHPNPPNSSVSMFTRNLIGSLTVNASKLFDTNKKLGLWFVLQDLSVRTEGTFRLKMNFVDVGTGQGNGNTLNKGRAPVLATCFSDPFQVFSAKKFPGVIESTPLSKKFATQGIKIPIRKDGPKISNQSEYDAEEHELYGESNGAQ